MRKKDSQVCSVFFVLLGPTSVKAAHRTLAKLTPGFAKIGIIRLSKFEIILEIIVIFKNAHDKNQTKMSKIRRF